MTTQSEPDPDQEVAMRLLEADEQVKRITRAMDATVVVTDRRIAVARGERIAMDIPFDRLRRIQFDVERRRPATLVVVPELPRDEPQVLTIEPEHFEEVAHAIAIIGQRLAGLELGQ